MARLQIILGIQYSHQAITTLNTNSMKPKTILFSIAFALASIPAWAERCLILHLADGGTLFFPIAERPKITFDGGVVCVNTERLQIQNVRKYTIGDVDPTGIGAAAADNSERFDLRGGTVYVRLKSGSERITCHSVDGRELPVSKKALGNGVVAVDLSGIGREVVILTVGDESIKIQRP